MVIFMLLLFFNFYYGFNIEFGETKYFFWLLVKLHYISHYHISKDAFTHFSCSYLIVSFFKDVKNLAFLSRVCFYLLVLMMLL